MCGSEKEASENVVVYFPNDRTCFKVFENSTDWMNAEEVCSKIHRGGHLATLDSSERINFVKSKLNFKSK